MELNHEDITKIIFASALTLSVVAPTLSHAAYFVDQTKTWATNTRAQDVMGKSGRAVRAIDSMAYAPANAPTDFGSRYFLDRGIGSQS
jgi:hypothetical protein